MDQIVEIHIGKIKVGEHDQRMEEEDSDVDELAASIRKVGILVPLIVRRSDDQYLLISGHRRLQAATLAGLSHVPVVCRTCSIAEETEVCFAENFFRKDLSPVELAGALKDCIEKESMTVKELAAGFHRSEHWVNSMVAIADWPADVLGAIHENGMSVSAASNLALVTDEEYRLFLLRNAVESGATARTTAAWLQAWQAMQPPEEAIMAEPVPAGAPQVPLVPQAPCLCCAQLFDVNRMSHVPVCGACIQILRVAGASGGMQSVPPMRQS
ncbi:Nucleoid occlusion protein [subsurface metagenome]